MAKNSITQVVLFVIDGMDVVNFTMANTPVMGGWHGRTAVGVAHTEIIGAGTTITPVAHAMMGTGQNVLAHRPGRQTTGRPYTYIGDPAVTVGDLARQAGMLTAAIGKNEVAIVLGGTDNLDISRLEEDGVSAVDDERIIAETMDVLDRLGERGGIVAVNYNGVDHAAHERDVRGVIRAVECADAIVHRIVDAVDLGCTLLIIAADHGTNPLNGRHSNIPTPLVLINEQLVGRVDLGVVHNLEIAITIASALGLKFPEALGRDLLALAGGGTGDYSETLEQQFSAYRAGQKARHLNHQATPGENEF
jgi:hypothetical protein